MKRISLMKKTIAAFVLAAFLSVTLSVAEAAPGRKIYPNPAQQQSQQSSRPAAQHPRANAPRPAMHQTRSGSARPRMHQPKPVSQRQTMHQPKHTEVSREKLRPKAHDPKPNIARPKTHDPKPNVARPKAHDQKPNVARPKTHDQKQSVAKPKTHDPKKKAAKPKIHEPKRHAPRPKLHEQRQNVAKPRIHDSKQNVAKPKVHDPKQHISKPKTHRPEYRKHRKPGPRKDLHRPPVHRTHENMHVWRRAPKPPKDHWWNHRPAHRRGRYRGYYNGIYYTDVLSALLVAEVIHSTYAAEPASVIYYAEDSTRPFIPKEAIKYKGHHYHVFSDIGNTMEDAQQFCESMGGHLAAVGDDEMNERMYRLINDSGYDNEYFEKFGHYRMIPNEPVTYVKANQESNLEEDEVFYGLYYWNYKNLTEDGTTDGTGGNAFVCEWDK